MHAGLALAVTLDGATLLTVTLVPPLALAPSLSVTVTPTL